MRWVLPLFVLGAALPATGQTLPIPDPDNPRVQTARWTPTDQVIVTALPKSPLTILLGPGEQIERVIIERRNAFDVQVSAAKDSLTVTPLTDQAASALAIDTQQRNYQLRLLTTTDRSAAYVLRFRYDDAALAETDIQAPLKDKRDTWLYRLRGDRVVRPRAISDDGNQTYIVFAKDQGLPAVFAIGPTGKEQVVNGHMRGDAFVIDAVWDKLVFRIDKEKATAQRSRKPVARDDG